MVRSHKEILKSVNITHPVVSGLFQLAVGKGQSADGFVFRAELKWWLFAGAGPRLIAWVTVGFLTMRAARVNPAECLRSE
jgi:hypothetical protein